MRTSNGSLWLGTDHLLSIDSTGYTENYKRFYFRDIQAITIEKTRIWQIWNFIWGTAVFIFIVLVVTTKPAGSPSGWSSDEIVSGIVFGGLTMLFTLFLLINLLWGATCKCFLRTAVQIEEFAAPDPQGAKGSGENPAVDRRRARRRIDPQMVAEKMQEQIPPPAESPAAVEIPTFRPNWILETPHHVLLAHQRCFNHATREAVARCPECHHFFCRECITEHDDRVLCTGCLKK